MSEAEATPLVLADVEACFSGVVPAVLMTVYQTALHAGAGTALRIALSTSLALLAVALLMAVRALRHDDGRIGGEVSPAPPG